MALVGCETGKGLSALAGVAVNYLISLLLLSFSVIEC